MGRPYVTHFKSVACTAAQDFFEILAGTSKPIKIHGFSLGQSTETGDAAEEMLVVTTNRGIGATSGSGGSTHTPQPIDDVDTASGATVEINNTTIMTAGGGSIEELEVHPWNVRVSYVFWYTPEMRPRIEPGDYFTVELESTPADSITISGNVWFEEV